MIVLALASLATANPLVQIGGSCPGIADVSITGATPNQPIATATASATGAFAVPLGNPCAGTVTGLSSVGFAPRATVTADATGSVRFEVNLPAAACGVYGQAVDLATCAASNTVRVPTNCTFVPNPADSVGEPATLTGTTGAHNSWRQRVGVSYVVWDPALAQTAQAYANTCPTNHDPNRNNIAGYSYVGENMFFASWDASGVEATTSWAGERSSYDFGTAIDNVNYQVFGHYTQQVWGDTVAIGCGKRSNCGAWRTTIVCRYGEGGNYIGQTPYDYTTGACYDLDNDNFLQGADTDDTDRTVH